MRCANSHPPDRNLKAKEVAMTQDLVRHFLKGNMDVAEAQKRVKSELKRMRRDIEAMERFEALLEATTRPNPLSDITAEQTALVQAAVAQHDFLRANDQSASWVGNVIAQALNIEISTKSNHRRVRNMIARWLEEDVLRLEYVRDKRQGRDVPIVTAGSPIEAAQ
jgi:hypothetical protein